MKCKEIIRRLENTFPKDAALDFDNVGLLAGRSDKEVKKVYLALDATGEVIQQAVKANADMLITHHPLIFTPLKAVTDEDFVSRRILTLIQNDISYYAMHTNYDVIGMSDMSEALLELSDTEILEETGNVLTSGCRAGIGRIGSLPREMTLRDCAAYVKQRFGLFHVNLFGDADYRVSRLAISPGSGKSMISPALQKGADVLVTGDIGHHEGIDAFEQGLCIIDAGHYGTEYLFMEDIKRYFAEHMAEIETECAPVKPPCQVI